MKTGYLLSFATGAALGLASPDFIATAAVDSPRNEIVNVVLAGADATLAETLVDQIVCSVINTKLDLTGSDKCVATSHARRVCLTWQEGEDGTEIHLSASTRLPGTWVPGSPQ